MIGIPIPGSPKAPAINDIAHKIELLALDVAQKINQGVTPAAAQNKVNVTNRNRSTACSQTKVNVRKEDGPIASRR